MKYPVVAFMLLSIALIAGYSRSARLDAIESRQAAIELNQKELEEALTQSFEIIAEALPKEFKENVNRITLRRAKEATRAAEQVLEELKKVKK